MQTYRPRSAYVWGWLAVGLGGAVALAQVWTTGGADAWVGLGLGLALAGCGTAAFLLPAIVVGADHIEVRNVVQTVTVPFARLAAVEAQWTLELRGDDGRQVGVMAAAARSRRDRHRPDQASPPEAVALVQSAWNAWRSSNEARHHVDEVATSAGPAFSRRPHALGIACVAVTVGSVAVAFLM